MKLNSAQLEAFFTVAKFANFTRAAETLNVTQSALSQRIAKLEDELETTLFIRNKNAIRLTDAGELVLRFCQLNDSSESDLLSRLKNSKDDLAGVVRVAGFSSVNRSLVIPSLRNIMGKNPRLSIQLLTREVRELEGLLKSSEADYIITDRKSESTEVENLFLGFEENVLVKSKRLNVSDIFLDHDEDDSTTMNYFSQNKLSYRPKNIRYLDDVYGLIDGVKCGYGNAVLPLHLIEDEKDLEILEPKRSLKVSVYLQFYKQPYYRRMHSYLIEDIQLHFQRNLRQQK